MTVEQGTPQGSYALSNLFTVNYFTGRLNVAIPLVQIGGRGEAKMTINAGLSNDWMLQQAYGPSNLCPNGGSCTTYSPILQQIWPGSATYSYGLQFGAGWVIAKGADSIVQGVMTNAYSVTRLYYYRPDGSSTELVDTTYYGQPTFTQCDPGYYCPAPPTNRGTNFISDDGSQVQFVSDTAISDWINYGTPTVRDPSGYLILHDGTKYRVNNGVVASMEDRNGNLVTISPTSIVDSLGRTTTFAAGTSTTGDYTQTLTYPGLNGQARPITIQWGPMSEALASGQSIQTYLQLFPNLTGTYPGAEPWNFNPTVMKSIRLNDGSEYQFLYNSYAQLAVMILPTGGRYEFDWVGLPGLPGGAQPGSLTITRCVSAIRDYPNGSTLAHQQIITYPPNYAPTAQGTLTISVADYDYTANSNGVLLRTVNHEYYSYANTTSPLDHSPWITGREFLTQTYTPSGALLESKSTVWAQKGALPWPDQGNPYLDASTPDLQQSYDPRIASVTTTNDAGQVSQVSYGYDMYNNTTDDYEYDWGSGAAGALLRHTQTTYNTAAAYLAAHLVSLPAEVKVYNGAGTLQADTQYGYDANAVTSEPNIVGHDNANFSGGGARGNVTSIARCATPGSCGRLTTASYYDVAGNTVQVTDANGHSTSYGYADNYSDGSNRNTYAELTSETNALGQTSRWQWDYSTGKPTQITDLNGANTKYSYNDPLDRLTTLARASGIAGFETQTQYVYQPYSASSPFTVTTKQDQATLGSGEIQSELLYDGFGRQTQTRQYESGGGYIANTAAYDGLGRVAQTTNPSRPGDALNYATTYGYDALNRPTSVATADGAVTTTTYNGYYTTVTDPAGHARVTQTDAAGRLTAVWEDPGSSPHFNYETTYQYDALNDLTQVNQGAETRTFSFDGLGRLRSASNPESGTTSYAYDGIGNVISKTDPRNITTGYTYDALNRVTQKTYSDGTPAVGYQYDASGAGYSWGHLTAEWNGNSTTQYTSIDPLGRVTASNQQTAGEWYGFTYYYNLAGALTYETYPSGRGVTTGYNASNQAIEVTGSYNGFGTAYVSGAWYWPHGAIGYYQLGTTVPSPGGNVWPNFEYNQRLQPSKIYAAINDSPNSFLFLECYEWGTPSANPMFGTCPTAGGTSDNGNLLGRISYEGGPGAQSALPSYTASFGYDRLNRLTSATDTGGWSRSFAYDQFGNGWVTNPTGIGYSLSTPAGNVYVYSNGVNKNQITSSYYDLAGNMLSFPPGMTFAYDAENRQISETNSGGLSASYLYNGEGKRVEKNLSNGQKIVYVYDALGKLAAEYDLQNPGTPPCSTCYLTYDHLGSLRMVTDANANVIARHDYIPFGEEIPGGIAGRNSQFDGYDNVNQKFTGKERDAESGLDYFGARYYGSSMGRFMSPDHPLIDQHPENPQSWNLYAYARNNPLINIDPTGLGCVTDLGQGSDANHESVELNNSISSDDCAGQHGTWVPGDVNKDNIGAYRGDDGSINFQAMTNTGGNVYYSSFVSGAQTDSNGVGPGADISHVSTSWLSGQLVGGSLDQLMSFAANRMQPRGGGDLMALLAGPGFSLDAPDNWAGPGGMGTPQGQGDWAALAHDYNFLTNGITIGSYFNPFISRATAKALIQSDNNLIGRAGGAQSVKMGMFFGVVNAFQWLTHPFF
ncbi:MAG: RHS repeat protein [Acidobacteriaceae bacterium]|nr:RHS repeat protein [Acidobacteriaceae bacterium]